MGLRGWFPGDKSVKNNPFDVIWWCCSGKSLLSPSSKSYLGHTTIPGRERKIRLLSGLTISANDWPRNVTKKFALRMKQFQTKEKERAENKILRIIAWMREGKLRFWYRSLPFCFFFYFIFFSAIITRDNLKYCLKKYGWYLMNYIYDKLTKISNRLRNSLTVNYNVSSHMWGPKEVANLLECEFVLNYIYIYMCVCVYVCVCVYWIDVTHIVIFRHSR